MKNLPRIKELEQLPENLTEKWLQEAIEKLDKTIMTPDQRIHYEMALAKAGSILSMRRKQRKKIREEASKKVAKIKEEANQKVVKVKEEAAAKNKTNILIIAKNLKDLGLHISEIAKSTGLTIAEVKRL